MQTSKFTGKNPPPRVIVVSHERSGTHFLMNSLNACFGYVSQPWTNYDYRSDIDVHFHAPISVKAFFVELAKIPLANVIKSHHHKLFFTENMELITKNFKILYIYRHPIATLRSFWKMLDQIQNWHEGPRGLNCNQFLRAPPMGYLMRYQMAQEPTMTHRWASHVEGWLNVADQYSNIMPVCYESLKNDYPTTINKISRFLQVNPIKIEMPPKNRNVVMETSSFNYDEECLIKDEDRMFIQQVAGPLLKRLGY
jgi:hypothetical protein